jgi:hypothetical protein
VDEFQEYRSMKERGATPQEVYRAGSANALDAITLIRLVRKVFGLSLGQAKEVSGATAALNTPQEVKIGASVSWEGWTSVEGFFVMEAQVKEIRGDTAELEGHRKFRVTDSGLEEVPVVGPRLTAVQVSYLEQPFAERLADALRFLEFARRPPVIQNKAV